jgi:hypothetical protein
VLDGSTAGAKADGRVVGAKVRAFEGVLDLADASVKRAIGDDNGLFRLPPGCKPLYGFINSSVSLGASTVSVGTTGATGKYRAAATHTVPDAPQLFMLSSASDDLPLGAEEDVLLTIGTAALPAAGIVTIVVFASAR